MVTGVIFGPDPADIRWQMVTCVECKRHYQCTPMDDYYGGLCTACLLRQHLHEHN